MKKKNKNVFKGVLNGKLTKQIFKIAKKKKFAIPAINCFNTDSINAALLAASKINSPIIIQFSYGGSIFFSGSLNMINDLNKKATIGAILGAKYVHKVSKYYNIPIILHTDHCNKKILPWLKNLIQYEKKYFKKKNKSLFSSHMIDLSQEPIKENIKTCKKYLKKIEKINMLLEVELGCTGGEEDGVNNENIKNNLLYTNPKDINYAYQQLKKINSKFILAAAFGNVHGVYQPGKVKLKPKILKKCQKYVKDKNKIIKKNPLNFVFHGGSGSKISDIKSSIKYGVVKINFDTDVQWSQWKGILKFYKKNKNFLKNQIGNPKGKNQPNKKYYDPRNWIEHSKNSCCKKIKKIYHCLNAYNIIKKYL
ncbi:class II fructose-bisphosphate aldolase [Buchnera aphidicola]|uniref:class II fructose-bisphosphate aldolase n=1 Tax=Buchnera aphidicola TaxID=9 RepID=UPI0030EDE9DE